MHRALEYRRFSCSVRALQLVCIRDASCIIPIGTGACSCMVVCGLVADESWEWALSWVFQAKVVVDHGRYITQTAARFKQLGVTGEEFPWFREALSAENSSCDFVCSLVTSRFRGAGKVLCQQNITAAILGQTKGLRSPISSC